MLTKTRRMISDEIFKITSHVKKDMWNEFIQNHPKGNIFQTPEMYEVYKRTKKYEPVFFAVVDESDNIKAMLLAHIIREFEGFLGHLSTRSIIQGGPLYEESEEGLNALGILMEHYDRIASKKVIYTEIRNRWGAFSISKHLKGMGYVYEDELNFLIDLTKPKEELWRNLSKSKRRAIRKAKEKGVIVEEMPGRDLIPIFYNLLQQTYKNARIPLADISLFESAFDILVPKKYAKFFIARHNNEYIGGKIVLIYRDVIYAWYGCSSRKHSKLYPSEMVTWHTIEWGAENGYHTFDFLGAGKPDEEYGVRDFKKQFGGHLVNFGRYKKIHSPMKLWLAERGFEIWRKLKQ